MTCITEQDDFINELGDKVGSFPNSFQFKDDYDTYKRRPRLESRMSICLPSKGFLNEPGDNNCFLKAAIQILWHVNVFRRSFRLLDGHACVENACIFCSLKRIFYQLEGSDESVLAAHEMRRAMANAFMDERRFQLGRMDDAAECFENILTRLHFHTAWRESEDSCSIPHCIPHQKFALHILEQTSCKCKATSEPKPFYQFVYYVAASLLVQQAKICQREKRPLTLGQLLRRTAQFGDIRPCPDEKRCKYKGHSESMTRIENTLLNRPDVVTVGIIWDTDCPSSAYIMDVMDCISETLFIVDMFDRVLEEDYKRLEMKITGVVTYYGRHYTSFFYNIREKQWLFFDDAQVSQIGPSWRNVKEKCERTRFQPLLIVFTNGSGSVVNIENAPKATEKISKELLLTVQSPLTKPPTHRKHKQHRKHKKGRHSSPSTPDKPSASERTSSRSSNGSASPSSPRRQFSPNGEMINEHPSRTSLETRYEPQVMKLNDDMSYNRPPRALLSMKGSASDGSLADMALNGDNDYIDATNRKRSGSMKKRVGNVLKSMNPYKASKTKPLSNTPSPDQEMVPATPAIVADVGYTSPYNKRSQNKDIPQPPRSPKAVRASPKYQNGFSSGTENSPKTQLKSLEVHKDNLSKSGHGHKSKHQHRQQNGHTPVEEHGGYFPGEMNGQVDQGRSNDLIHFNSRPEVFDEPDGRVHRENQERFQELLSVGDMHLTKAELCERKGDLLLALRCCSEATTTYREASRVPGISDDLLQYADSKRTQSFHWSQELQRQVGDFLNNGTPTGYGHHDRHNVPVVRTESTSGYSSMSENTFPGDDYRKHPYADYHRQSNDTDAQQQDLINLHKPTNLRQQTLDKLRPNTEWSASSADSIRRASMDLLPKQRKPLLPPPSRHVVPNYGHTNYNSKTLPNPHSKTNIRWVVDKNNETTDHRPQQYDSPDEDIRNTPQNLKQPEIPRPRVGSDVGVMPNMSTRNDFIEDRKPIVFKDTSKVTIFDDVRDVGTVRTAAFPVPNDTVLVSSTGLTDRNNATEMAKIGHVNVKSFEILPQKNLSINGTVNTKSSSLASLSDTKTAHVSHQSFHATLRNNGASRSSSFNQYDVTESQKTTRKQVHSIYDNVENNAEERFKPSEQENENVSETKPRTIYDDVMCNNTSDKSLNMADENTESAETSAPSARELIKRLNQQNKTNPGLSINKPGVDIPKNSTSTFAVPEKNEQDKIPSKPKQITKNFSKNLTLQPPNKKEEEELNTLQRLNKEGKLSARCPKCKWRKVEIQGEYCQECRAEYMSTLMRKVAPKDEPVPSTTLEKLRKGDIRKYKCVQCGWKQVLEEGGYCDGCQSEYL